MKINSLRRSVLDPKYYSLVTTYICSQHRPSLLQYTLPYTITKIYIYTARHSSKKVIHLTLLPVSISGSIISPGYSQY